jgi:NAD-dependent SIR2 family protein deacetylase
MNSIHFGELEVSLELITAQTESKLVVFAGAGVSMQAGLPSFKQLVEKIVENVIDPHGNLIDLKKEQNKSSFETYFHNGQYDRLLGDLKRQNGLQVHKIMEQEIKKSPASLHAHEVIKNLFPTGSLKIVTTNFDDFFEKVGVRDTHIAPALPSGDNFSGLVYLHGHISHPEECVLTEEDFGKAYFTGGWAREFLHKLFSNYTVLFIGYSLNDPPLRYLLSAIPVEHAKRHFIILEEKYSQNAMLIQPIIYKDDQHEQLYQEHLQKWVNFIRKPFLDMKCEWQKLLATTPNQLFSAQSDRESELKLICHLSQHYQIFIRYAKHPQWLKWADDQKLLQKVFFWGEQQTDDKTFYFTKWIIENFITDASAKDVIALLQKYDYQANYHFWRQLTNHLSSDKITTHSIVFRGLFLLALKYDPNLIHSNSTSWVLLIRELLEDHTTRNADLVVETFERLTQPILTNGDEIYIIWAAESFLNDFTQGSGQALFVENLIAKNQTNYLEQIFHIYLKRIEQAREFLSLGICSQKMPKPKCNLQKFINSFNSFCSTIVQHKTTQTLAEKIIKALSTSDIEDLKQIAIDLQNPSVRAEPNTIPSTAKDISYDPNLIDIKNCHNQHHQYPNIQDLLDKRDDFSSMLKLLSPSLGKEHLIRELRSNDLQLSIGFLKFLINNHLAEKSQLINLWFHELSQIVEQLSATQISEIQSLLLNTKSLPERCTPQEREISHGNALNPSKCLSRLIWQIIKSNAATSIELIKTYWPCLPSDDCKKQILVELFEQQQIQCLKVIYTPENIANDYCLLTNQISHDVQSFSLIFDNDIFAEIITFTQKDNSISDKELDQYIELLVMYACQKTENFPDKFGSLSAPLLKADRNKKIGPSNESYVYKLISRIIRELTEAARRCNRIELIADYWNKLLYPLWQERILGRPFAFSELEKLAFMEYRYFKGAQFEQFLNLVCQPPLITEWAEALNYFFCGLGENAENIANYPEDITKTLNTIFDHLHSLQQSRAGYISQINDIHINELVDKLIEQAKNNNNQQLAKSLSHLVNRLAKLGYDIAQDRWERIKAIAHN